MNISLKKILYILMVLFFQCLLDNYADLGLYLRIVIIPFVILMLPYRYKTISTMIIAFLLGLTVDLFTSGVLGLNAGAMTAVAFVRQKVLHSILDERNMERHDSPDYIVLGLGKGLFYIMFHYIVFFTAYTLLDNMGFAPFGLTVTKILLSTSVSGLIALWALKKYKKI